MITAGTTMKMETKKFLLVVKVWFIQAMDILTVVDMMELKNAKATATMSTDETKTKNSTENMFEKNHQLRCECLMICKRLNQD